MEIKPGRMVSLGYGKFWRSDAIVGLMPIGEERGPGHRTEVYTATLDHPIVASRSERAILEDMAFLTGDGFHLQEAREILSDLADALADVPDVVKRMLSHETHFDASGWILRLRTVLAPEGEGDVVGEQNDFFE
ncbi:MAG: hypothetical protein O7I93_14805 [Gemmatimonadetes bacterium]|nr:hypothetical protein [Gemmatimonadota bacterium]